MLIANLLAILVLAMAALAVWGTDEGIQRFLSQAGKHCKHLTALLSARLLSSPSLLQQRPKVGKHPRSWIATAIGTILGIGFSVSLHSGSKPSINPVARTSSSDYTPAQMVTYLDRRHFDATATAQMQERLSRLCRNYGLTEYSSIRIADSLVKTQELLEKDGISMTVCEIADSIEAAAPRAGVIDLDELLAIYVTLRSKNSNVETIAQMRALFNELGLGTCPPSEAIKRRYNELGIASAEVGVAAYGGVGGLLRKITKKSGPR